MLKLPSFKPQMKTISIFHDPAARLPPCHSGCSNWSLPVGYVAVHVLVDKLVVAEVLVEVDKLKLGVVRTAPRS